MLGLALGLNDSGFISYTASLLVGDTGLLGCIFEILLDGSMHRPFSLEMLNSGTSLIT